MPKYCCLRPPCVWVPSDAWQPSKGKSRWHSQCQGVHWMELYKVCGLAHLTDCVYSHGVCIHFVNCAGRSLHYFLPPFGLGAIGHWAGDNSICCLWQTQVPVATVPVMCPQKP